MTRRTSKVYILQYYTSSFFAMASTDERLKTLEQHMSVVIVHTQDSVKLDVSVIGMIDALKAQVDSLIIVAGTLSADLNAARLENSRLTGRVEKLE